MYKCVHVFMFSYMYLGVGRLENCVKCLLHYLQPVADQQEEILVHSCFHFLSTETLDIVNLPRCCEILCGAEDLNPGPHACIPNTKST